MGPNVIKYFLTMASIRRSPSFAAVSGYDVNLEMGGKEVDTAGKVDNEPDFWRSPITRRLPPKQPSISSA